MRSELTPIAVLTALPTPRVWSMLVTIFGDLAQAPGDVIDGPVLTRLTAGMGIKPEAVRVALHRLRNDDWIVSEKSGRTAIHALTPFGRNQSAGASSVIYGAPRDMPKGWQLALTQTNTSAQRDKMQKAGFTQLIPRVFFASTHSTPPKDAVSLSGTVAPDWLYAEIVPREVTGQYSELLTLFQNVSQALPEGLSDPAQVAILRCLIVHHWRRIVLRHPYLPPDLTGADWPGHLCRHKVTSLLARLPRPALSDLRQD